MVPSVAMLTAKAKRVWIRITGQIELVRQRSAPQVKPPQKVSAVRRTASGQGPSVAFLPRTSNAESKEGRITARTGPSERNVRHKRPRKTISSPKVATATVRNAEANEAGPDPKTPPERINAHTSSGKTRSRRFLHCDGRLKPASRHHPVHASRPRANTASVTSMPKTTGRLPARRLTSILPHTDCLLFARGPHSTFRADRTIRVVHSTLRFPEKS